MQIEVPTAETMRKIFRLLLENHDWTSQPNIHVRNVDGLMLYTLTLDNTTAKYFAHGNDFYNMNDDEIIDIDLPLSEAIKLKLRV